MLLQHFDDGKYRKQNLLLLEGGTGSSEMGNSSRNINIDFMSSWTAFSDVFGITLSAGPAAYMVSTPTGINV